MLILDANILIRASIARAVPRLLAKYSRHVQFLAPDSAFREAEEHLPALLERRGIVESEIFPPGAGSASLLDRMSSVVEVVPQDIYYPFKDAAWARIAQRDPDDWPALAAALALNCPIWTEDVDFFGTGVATWTTDRVEIYLQSFPAGE